MLSDGNWFPGHVIPGMFPALLKAVDDMHVFPHIGQHSGMLTTQ